jgi:hypothetical protein
MAKDLFNRYIWLVDTIYRAGKITFEEINERWSRNETSEGKEIPLRTFHNHRVAIEEMFDINIECDKRDGYVYYIQNKDDMERGGVRAWLLNTFAVNNLINESHKLKHRILFEQIPSGQRFLTPLIEAMRDGLSVEMTYQGFWHDEPYTCVIEPRCVKIFKQRWYVIAKSILHDAVRVFSLDRIQEARVTDIPFKLPPGFDPESRFEDRFGIIVDDDIEPCKVEIKAYGNKCKYLRTLPLHHSQEETGTTGTHSVFSYFLAPTFDFRQEILSHGEEIEVLSPRWFRDEIKNIIRDMNKLYKK